MARTPPLSYLVGILYDHWTRFIGAHGEKQTNIQMQQQQPARTATAHSCWFLHSLPSLPQHLIAWAQIGVLVRVYFADIFGSACPSITWAPCLASSGSRYGGAFFADLPSNIFGSFLMGLFVSSDVLSNSLKHVLSVEAPMAMLPIKSPLQDHLAFQVRPHPAASMW
jgi:hypothetical protein